MTKIIIDRKQWYRGLGGICSRLLNGENRMCCLGFTCEQLGTPKGILFGVAYPEDLDKDNPLKDKNIDSISSMISTNDDKDIDDIEREEKLKELAKEIDLEFEFIN